MYIYNFPTTNSKRTWCSNRWATAYAGRIRIGDLSNRNWSKAWLWHLLFIRAANGDFYMGKTK